MRIEQQNNILEMLQQNSGAEKGSNALFVEKATVAKSKHSDNQSVYVKDSTYLNPALEGKKSLAEEVEEETSLDATSRKNQMAVLSHTTSEEDYAKMQEEGFSLTATNGNTIVTVTDKIKAQIAKAGGDISCFGDDLTREQLEELTGSQALAGQIEHALKKADLPASNENIEDCMKAYALAETVQPLTEGGIKYLLDNGMEPTIENIYKATYSGGTSYTATSADEISLDGIQVQVERIITEAGLSVNEQTLYDCRWLMANEVALTVENLSYLEDLKGYSGILDTDELINAMAEAMAEGHMPKDAMLLSGYSKMNRASDARSVITSATEEDLAYLIDKGMELTIANLKIASNDEKAGITISYDDLRLLTAKRQLEETRLAMTAEANYALLKKGISIDTKPLAELVEELKKQENAYYEKLLEAQGVETSEENVTIFAETTEKLDTIKSVPAYVLGIPDTDVSHIEGVYENGTALKAAMERANQSYEPLMTTPRREFGDTYEKAFRNVDDILSDLEMQLTEENRRAVRILAYNQLEITQESVIRMKAADEEVQRTFKNLTPKVVVEMLRRGDNPLNMDFSMINKTAESIKQELDGDDTERFSEYLWKLEQNHSISEEERSSYIGVYRLLHQVEQTDGAAIGALLNQGSDITLRNLLTAVRSANKQKKMDFKVDESFGEREKSAGYHNSITDQIMAGYQTNCVKDAKEVLTPAKMATLMKKRPDWMEMTPEQFTRALAETDDEDADIESAYIREQLAQIKQCVQSPEEVYRMLEQYDIPNSIQNILAMESMMRNRNQFYRKLFEPVKTKDASSQEELATIKQQLLESFGEAVSSPEEMAKAQDALAKVAENVMKTMIDGEEVTAIDIKEARLMRAQLAIQQKMTKDETYSVPVLVGDEVTNVTLKIVHGVEKRGIVDIMLESRISGKIAATFQAREAKITGTIVTDDAKTKEELEAQIEAHKNTLQEKNEEIDLKVVHIPELDLNHFSTQAMKEAEDSATEAGEITTTRLYQIAESFIRVVKETYK